MTVGILSFVRPTAFRPATRRRSKTFVRSTPSSRTPPCWSTPPTWSSCFAGSSPASIRRSRSDASSPRPSASPTPRLCSERVELVDDESSQRGGRRPPLHREPGRRVVGHQRVSRSLRRGAAPADRGSRGRERRASRLSAAHAPGRPTGCGDAARARQPRRHPRFRPGADYAPRCQKLVGASSCGAHAGPRRTGATPRRTAAGGP